MYITESSVDYAATINIYALAYLTCPLFALFSNFAWRFELGSTFPSLLLADLFPKYDMAIGIIL